MKIRYSIAHMVLCAEVLVIGGFYLFSPQGGLRAIEKAWHETQDLEVQVVQLQNAVALVASDINRWQSDTFYVEKIAREQLQMMRPSEEIYYIRS